MTNEHLHGPRAVRRATVKRREDPRLLTGHGRYVDDHAAGDAALRFVRSDVARGRIVRVDVDAAARARRRRRRATAADLNPHAGAMQPTCCSRWPGRRRCARWPTATCASSANPIVLIVAQSRYVAEDAAELVDIDIDSEPAVDRCRARASTTTRRSCTPNSARTWAQRWRSRSRRAAATPGGDDVVRRHSASTAIRPSRWRRGIVADVRARGGEMRVWMSDPEPARGKHGDRPVSRACPAHRVRVEAHDVGGGFGQKFFTPGGARGRARGPCAWAGR